MRFRATIPSGDYTSTGAWIEVPCGLPTDDYNLKRVQAQIAGNAAAGELGLYQRPADEAAAPADALLANAEEFYDTNVVARTAPRPELNLTPSYDSELYFDNANSFYVYWLAVAGDTTTSGTVDFWLEKK